MYGSPPDQIVCCMRFHPQMHGLVATGGGDGPEDIPAALQAVAQLDWRSKARFAVLITDAPAHGADCNDDPHDSFPRGSPRPGCEVATVMAALRKQEVDLMVRCGCMHCRWCATTSARRRDSCSIPTKLLIVDVILVSHIHTEVAHCLINVLASPEAYIAVSAGLSAKRTSLCASVQRFRVMSVIAFQPQTHNLMPTMPL